MKCVFTIIAIILLAAPIAIAQDAPASSETSEQPASKTATTHAYVLEHIGVADATRLIEALVPPHNKLRVVPDLEANSLYVQADPEAQKWLDALITNLDVSSRESPAATTEQIRLEQIEANEMLRLVDNLGMLSQNLTVVVAPNSNTLIVRGSGESIEDLKRLVENVDQPRRAPTSFTQTLRGGTKKRVVVTLDRAGQAIVAGRVPTVAEFESMLGPENLVEVVIDHDVGYSKVASLIDRLRESGAKRVGIRLEQRLSATAGLPAPASTPKPRRSAAEVLRHAYESAEHAAAKSAQKWREENQKKSPSSKRLADLRSSLAGEVQAAFRLRQQWQWEQLEQHRQELSLLNERLERRERIAQQIINHRVRELQSGKDLSWLLPDETMASSSGVSAQTKSTAATTGDSTRSIDETSKNRGTAATLLPGTPTAAPDSMPSELLTFSEDGQTLTITSRTPEHLSKIEKRLRSNVPSNSIFLDDGRFVIRVPDAEELQIVAEIISDIDEIDALYESIQNASQVPIYLFGPAGSNAEPSFAEDLVMELPARFHLDAGHLFALDVSGAPGASIQHVAIKVHDLSDQALEYFKAHELPVSVSIADLRRVREGREIGQQYFLVPQAGKLRLETVPIGDSPAPGPRKGELVAELRMGNRKPRSSKAYPSRAGERRLTNFEPVDSVLFVEMIVSEPGEDESATPTRTAVYMDGTVVADDGLVAVVMDRLLDRDGNLRAQIDSITFKTYRGEAIHDAKYMIHDPTTGLALLRSRQIPVPALRLDGPTVVASQGVELFGRAIKDPLGVTVFKQNGWSMDTQVGFPASDVPADRNRFLVRAAEGLSGSAITLTTTGQLVGILTTKTTTKKTNRLESGTLALPVALIDDLVRKLRDREFRSR